MKLKFITCLAGADFCHNPGDVAEVDGAQAARFIAAGYAEPVKVNKAKRTTAKPEQETATLDTVMSFAEVVLELAKATLPDPKLETTSLPE